MQLRRLSFRFWQIGHSDPASILTATPKNCLFTSRERFLGRGDVGELCFWNCIWCFLQWHFVLLGLYMVLWNYVCCFGAVTKSKPYPEKGSDPFSHFA